MAKVNWTMQAMEDLADIDAYISESSEKYADFVVSSIMATTDQIGLFPQSGRVVPETRINSIRELIILKYRIIYQIASIDKINILTIRHSSKPLSEF